METNRISIGKILPNLGPLKSINGSNTFEIFHFVSLTPHLGTNVYQRLCSAGCLKTRNTTMCQITGQ